MIITCPDCGYAGSNIDFDMSLCDECFCPMCTMYFILEEDDE